MFEWFIGLGVTAIVLIIAGLILCPLIVVHAFGGRMKFLDYIEYGTAILFVVACVWFVTIGLHRVGDWMLHIVGR